MPTLPTTSLFAYQGDTYKLRVTWKDSSGAAVDLTGASAEFGMATTPGSNDSFQYSDSDYLTITAGTGTIDFEIPHTVTRTWGSGRYQFELTVTESDATRTTILRGKMRVYPEVVE